mgnify:CR=1 FL=1
MVALFLMENVMVKALAVVYAMENVTLKKTLEQVVNL